MSDSSPFKYVFWGLVILVVMSMMGVGFMFGCRTPMCGGVPFARAFPLFPMYLVAGLYVGVVGLLVHRDASRRGLDPWMWATVAAFVPYLIGVIIYLVVSRSRAGATCSNCGQTLRTDFKVCPHCGHARELLCEKCQKPMASEWKVCPYCGHSPAA